MNAPGHSGQRLSRRRVLALLGLGTLAACDPAARVGAPAASSPPSRSSDVAGDPTTPPSTRAPSSTPSSAGATGASEPTGATPTPEPSPLPVAAPFEPLPEDVYPNAKRTAARVVEALTTYPAGADPAALVRDVAVRARDFDDAAAVAAAAPLLHAGRSSVGVVLNGQLGGLDPAPETGRQPTTCSVMVVVDQHLTEGADAVESVRRCIDVRLGVTDGEWRWTGLGDAGGTAVERPGDLPEVAGRVLDHPAIDLPDSARWDIYRGVVEERLLDTMVVMAEIAPYRVTALRAGHPETVFAKSYLSNHTVGRAVDVWSVGGDPVVAQSRRVLGVEDSAGTPAHRMTATLLADTGVTELGSPWDLDGPATADRPRTRSFTNVVHADHLHVAFDGQG